jgi:2-polyprenyl-6-methoxyphenol hydroxylase-like FAD-dependent oxidoreductase
VVLGGGLAGMLAAVALARHVSVVTVVERDPLPHGPRARKGVPQARHAHMLMSGGARAIEGLLPGTVDRLVTEGAHRIGMPSDIVSLTAYGWQHRFPATRSIITCSRELLDWVVRDEATRNDVIAVLDGNEAVGLCGSASRVSGARIRPGDGGPVRELGADLVVNATGRASPMRRWFSHLGVPMPETDVVDTGIAYATRVFRAPPAASRGFPLVVVYADHREPRPGRNAVLMPIESGRWIVTLSGTRGGEPSATDEEGFAAFARGVRDPIIASLIAKAEPIGPVHGSRSTANRRLRYDWISAWPEGFVVVGDALAAFNPVHGHGMSAAALGAEALERTLRTHGLVPGLAASAQRAIGAAMDDAWLLATSLDVRYPGCRVSASDTRLTARPANGQSFADLLGTAALSDPVVSAAMIEVNTLSAPLESLQTPRVITALRQRPPYPPLASPPLSAGERATVLM